MPFDRDRQDSRGGRPRGRRKKVCSFCVDRIDHIDYKDIPRLRKYISEHAFHAAGLSAKPRRHPRSIR